MKIVGLDLGDRWVGIALSDALQMTCRPYKTATIATIVTELQTLLTTERVERIVFGLPRTMRGTESEQTLKVRSQAEQLIATLSANLKREIPYSFGDERLTSQWAQNVRIEKNVKKQKSGPSLEHAVAAAFVLQNYLDSKAFQASRNQEDSP